MKRRKQSLIIILDDDEVVCVFEWDSMLLICSFHYAFCYFCFSHFAILDSTSFGAHHLVPRDGSHRNSSNTLCINHAVFCLCCWKIIWPRISKRDLKPIRSKKKERNKDEKQRKRACWWYKQSQLWQHHQDGSICSSLQYPHHSFWHLEAWN